MIEKIDTGQLGLPEYRRLFVWKDAKGRRFIGFNDEGANWVFNVMRMSYVRK